MRRFCWFLLAVLQARVMLDSAFSWLTVRYLCRKLELMFDLGTLALLFKKWWSPTKWKLAGKFSKVQNVKDTGLHCRSQIWARIHLYLIGFPYYHYYSARRVLSGRKRRHIHLSEELISTINYYSGTSDLNVSYKRVQIELIPNTRRKSLKEFLLPRRVLSHCRRVENFWCAKISFGCGICCEDFFLNVCAALEGSIAPL